MVGQSWVLLLVDVEEATEKSIVFFFEFFHLFVASVNVTF